MRRLSLPCAFAASFLLAGSGAEAAAQTPASDAVQRADALFRAGREAMRQHRYTEACARFRDSDALDPSPGTRLNLALCEAQVGHLAQGLTHARWARDHLETDDTRYPIAGRLTSELEARAGHLAVRWSAPHGAGAQLYLDGEPLAADEARTVDPGEHVVLAEEPWHDLGRFVVVVHEGESATLDATAGPEWAIPDAGGKGATPLAPRASPARRTVGYVLAGVAGAGLVGTALLGAVALGERGTVEQHCPGKLCDAQGLDAGARGRAFVNAGTVALGVSAASAACAAVLLWPHKAGAVGWTTPVTPVAGGVKVGLGGEF